MEESLIIRQFQRSDADKLWLLKTNTIRSYCIKDYTANQVSVWAPEIVDKHAWDEHVLRINPYIAESKGTIIGFADLQSDGYIDHFYCKYDCIGKGVGGLLMRHILSIADDANIERVYSHVSITARPFFEHFGFRVLNSQQVNIKNVQLTNFVMELKNKDIR